MDSPVRLVAAALLAGAATGLLAPGLAWIAVGVTVGAAAAVALVAGLRGDARRRLAAAAVACAAAAGTLRGAVAARGPSPVAAQELAACEGVVVRGADVNHSPAAADGEDQREASFRIDTGGVRLEARLRYREGDTVPPLLPGDAVRLVGSVEPIRAPTNPGEPDRRAAARREGVAGEIRANGPDAVRVLDPPPIGAAAAVQRVAERVRRVLLARLEAACDGPNHASALLGCLLFGDRTSLPATATDAYRDSGTAHLLSVSGLHVVLLAASARALARRLLPRRARRRIGLPALTLLLAAYCAVCRFATPVVRAAVFLAVAELARRTGRRPSPIDTLAVAAAVVVGADPAQVLDVSFQLSFAAVAGLALFTRGLRSTLFPALALYRRFRDAVPARRLRFLENVATGLATSLAASAATAPIVGRVFGRLQPVAPFANLVAVPIAAVLLPFAAALVATGGTCAAVTAPLAAAGTGALAGAARVAASIPFASVDTGRASLAACAASVALLAAAALRIRSRPRQGAALVAAAWIAVAAAPFAERPPRAGELVVLDVGHGLAVLATSQTGSAVLFDAGGHAPAVGRATIAPALRELGVRRLGAVFLSHDDADHCSALLDVLARVRVGEVVVSPGFGAAPLPRALVAACRARGVPVTVVARGDRFTRLGIDVRVLSPLADRPAASDNEASIVAHVTIDGRMAALVPGDIESAALAALVRDATVPPADVLILPHHGRGDPTEQRALAARLGASVLVASTSPSAPMTVADALVTGRTGALRIRPGETPAGFPWPP